MTNDLSPRRVSRNVRRAVFALIEAQGWRHLDICWVLRHRDRSSARPMARSTLDTRRTGRTEFTAPEIVLLANAFGVSIDALCMNDVEVHKGKRTITWRAGNVRGSRPLDVGSGLLAGLPERVQLPGRPLRAPAESAAG